VASLIDKPNKLVIFDCDGTLVDGQHMIIDAMDLCFEREGLTPPPRKDSRSIIGLSLKEAMEVLLPGSDDDYYHYLSEQYKTAYLDLNVKTGEKLEPLYDGTVDALKELDGAGYLLAVATGKSMRGLQRVLTNHELDHMFVSLQTADGHPSKPHPSMIHTAIADAGSAPESAIMVGDTSYDMMMAKSANVAAIGVSWGYHDIDILKASDADSIIEDYADLSSIVETILR